MRKNSISISSIFVLFLVVLTGCQQGVNVSGKVEYPDGKPVTLGTVCFQSEHLLARGDIAADGSFKMQLTEAKSKIPYGSYGVYVSGAVEIEQLPPTKDHEIPVLPEEKVLIDVKFMSADTSGLQCEVKRGMALPYVITVDYPKP